MRQTSALLLLIVLVTNVHGAPQLLSFKDGKIGVNFAGYHASAGLGGLLGDRASGGLFAEAGTPFGQSAHAGLGGAVDKHGQSGGRLYAGARAGDNVNAEAGLGGGVLAERTAGAGYASAQAGNKVASTGLVGGASIEGSSGLTFTKTKSYGGSGGFVKEVEVAPPVHPVEIYKEIDVKVDAANEVKPLHSTGAKIDNKAFVNGDLEVKAEAPPTVLVKEVYVQPPPKVYEKEVHYRRIKPHRHFHKTAFIGGYIGGDGSFEAPPPPPLSAPVVYKTKVVHPVIEKRVDVGVDSEAHIGGAAHAESAGTGGGQFGYTKQVNFQRNPTFFADIFNIPISTLKAVGNFLGNAAGSTSVSVQKTASIQADKEGSLKHAPSSTASSSSEAHISVQTPNVSSFIDDIFSIPINTLGAVNKFLENNVPARKRVQVSEDGEPTHVNLGPRARRRANKRVVIVESPEPATPKVQSVPSIA